MGKISKSLLSYNQLEYFMEHFFRVLCVYMLMSTSLQIIERWLPIHSRLRPSNLDFMEEVHSEGHLHEK